VDQPFRLRAELGRVVVLVFAESANDPAVRRLWELLAARDDSLFLPATVVVGIFRGAGGYVPVQALAASLGSRFKFLPDSLGRAFRRFGVVGPAAGAVSLFVITGDGRVAYRSRDFRVDAPAELERMAAAVRGRPPGGGVRD